MAAVPKPPLAADKEGDIGSHSRDKIWALTGVSFSQKETLAFSCWKAKFVILIEQAMLQALACYLFCHHASVFWKICKSFVSTRRNITISLMLRPVSVFKCCAVLICPLPEEQPFLCPGRRAGAFLQVPKEIADSAGSTAWINQQLLLALVLCWHPFLYYPNTKYSSILQERAESVESSSPVQ